MKQLIVKRWKCSVCGYIHEGNNPPDTCPVCSAPKTAFEEYDY
jgi:ferredoxin hydrogenase